MIGIESYNLFGEREDLPDVVHCETIEARSRIHDWEFKPHRHARLHQFILVESGGGTAFIEENQRPLTAGELINMPMGVVHGFSFLPGTHGWVVTLTSELLAESLHDSEGLRPLLSEAKVMQFTSATRNVVKAIFAEYATMDYARAHVLRGLSAVLAGLVARTLSEDSPNDVRTEHGLQRRFETLVEERYREHLPVSEYARMLAVTPTHLSRVMRHTAGHSASAAIEERLIREARRYLAFSNLAVSEIGYQLGFNDPAYFSRVFTRATGQSPRAFRQRLET